MKSFTFLSLKAKLNGFTIAELMVVSVLSLVCAAAAFSALNVFDTNFRSYESDNAEQLKINNTYTLLQTAFIQSEKIIFEENEIIFRKGSIDVNYRFESTHLIRFSNQSLQKRDTLLTGTFSTKAYWNNSVVDYGPIDQLEVTVQTAKQDQKLSFHFSKDYSAQNLIHGIKN